MPNNREWALLFWTAAFIVWAVQRPEVRASLRGVGRAAFRHKVAVLVVGLAAWVAMEVWLGSLLSLWDARLTTDTGFWFVGTGLVLFGNFDKAWKHPHFFRAKAAATLGVTVFIEGYTELVVLNFPAELLLQPVVAVLASLAVVASTKEEYRPVAKVIEFLMGMLGLFVLVYVTRRLIGTWHTQDAGLLIRQIGLPIWLTLGLLPYVYFVALFAGYESLFMRMDWKGKASGWQRFRNKLALLASFHVKAFEVASFAGVWPHRLADARSFADARLVAKKFRHEKSEERRKAAEAEERLRRFAGIRGIDEEGRQLDQREFDATKDALRWIAVCHMGWYRRSNAYRSDLLEMLGDEFIRQGLPKPSGISMEVATDGQSWYAWRRTIGGWCFAIGADGPPPEQWEYDGPAPPCSYPRADPVWGSGPFSGEANRNW